MQNFKPYFLKENKKNISKYYLPKILPDMLSINPFMPSGLFYLNSLDRSIAYIRGESG